MLLNGHIFKWFLMIYCYIYLNLIAVKCNQEHGELQLVQVQRLKDSRIFSHANTILKAQGLLLVKKRWENYVGLSTRKHYLTNAARLWHIQMNSSCESIYEICTSCNHTKFQQGDRNCVNNHITSQRVIDYFQLLGDGEAVFSKRVTLSEKVGNTSVNSIIFAQHYINYEIKILKNGTKLNAQGMKVN